MGSFPETYNDPAGIYSLNTLMFMVLSTSIKNFLIRINRDMNRSCILEVRKVRGGGEMVKT